MFTRDGNDLHYTIKLSLVESLSGWKRSIPLIDGINLQTEMSKPTPPTHTIKHAGCGMPISKSPGETGDLILHFEVIYPDNLSEMQKFRLQEALRRWTSRSYDLNS